MREPRRLRFFSSLAAMRSMPSNMIVPALIRQPGRAKPIAASPMVDLPAPDSPMRPRTSPRLRTRSTPLTISCQRSSLNPAILRSRISRSTSPRVRAFRSVLIAKSARLVEEPVDDEVYGNGEQGDCRRRNQGNDSSVGDQRLVFRHHRTPVGGWRLDADAQEGQGADREEYETEAQAELGNQRRRDIGHDFAEHQPRQPLP